MIHLTSEQERIVQAGVDFYRNSSEQVFQIAGNPGTGKSVVLNEIFRRLQIPANRVAPMAFVGSAACVMRMKGLYNAKTIHSWLYHPVEVPVLDADGRPVMDPYFNTPLVEMKYVPTDLIDIDVILIDEAGAVPMWMKADIESRGKKIFVAGDLDQLKPVGDEPAYLTTGKVHVLTQIMRQAEGNPIIYLSQRAKLGLPIHTGVYGNNVLVTTQDQITDSMMRWSDVLICAKNKTKDFLNNKMRREILGITSDLPDYNEKLICRQNNWGVEVGGINLTNGLIGRVINKPDVSGFDGKKFTIDFLPTLTNMPFYGIDADYTYLLATQEQKNVLKNSKFYNGNKFEFGYAINCWVAQGSQFTHGMYFEEYINPDTNKRLNYTALSRFSDQCIYVKPSRKYY